MIFKDFTPFDAVVHQAEGALSARLHVPIEEAAMILRIRANLRGLPVRLVADEVLGRRPAPPVDPNIAGTC